MAPDLSIMFSLFGSKEGILVPVSKYNDAAPGDPIPTEVTTTENRNGALSSRQRLIQSNAQFNAPVDPASFTLSGLGMPVGTPVVDVRIHRQIGYWTGTGLSENHPPKAKTTEPATSPSLTDLLSALETDPASDAGLEAATWILLNTPDGPAV